MEFAGKGEAVMNWKVHTKDSAISLHDHSISSILLERDITLLFEEGFDVAKSNALNTSGHHKHTGTAGVVLKNAQYIQGIKYFPEDVEENMKTEELEKLDFEILTFSYHNETKIVEIFGEAGEEAVFGKLVFQAEEVEYCWNEFVEDAWFGQ